MTAKTFWVAFLVLTFAVFLVEVRAQTPEGMKESLSGNAPADEGSIDGRVVLPSGRAVGQIIRVTLEVGGSAVKTVYTDSTGVFHITNVAGGVYSVRAYGDDLLYLPGTQDLWLKVGASVQLTIYLRAKSNGSEQVAGIVSAEDWDKLASRDAKKSFEKAQKLIGKGEVDSGIEELKHTVTVYPDYASARNALGVQYLKRNQLQDAAREFEYILNKAPKFFDAKFNLGLVRLQQQQYPDAARILNDAVSIDSSNAACHMWLGVARLQSSDLKGAEEEIVRAQALGGPQLPAVHYYLGQVYARENRKEDACRQFGEYLKESSTGDLASDSRRIMKNCGPAAEPKH